MAARTINGHGEHWKTSGKNLFYSFEISNLLLINFM